MDTKQDSLKTGKGFASTKQFPVFITLLIKIDPGSKYHLRLEKRKKQLDTLQVNYTVTWDIHSVFIVNLRPRQTLVTVSCSVMSNSLQPHGLCCPWDSPGKNTAVGCHSLLQEIFQPRDQTQVSCIAGRFFTVWATRDKQHKGRMRQIEACYKGNTAKRRVPGKECYQCPPELHPGEELRVTMVPFQSCKDLYCRRCMLIMAPPRFLGQSRWTGHGTTQTEYNSISLR